MNEVPSTVLSLPSLAEPGPSALSRVVIENVQPEVNSGQFPVKRILGNEVFVTADIHADGHDVLAAVLCYRPLDRTEWTEISMTDQGNDVWRGQFRMET